MGHFRSLTAPVPHTVENKAFAILLRTKHKKKKKNGEGKTICIDWELIKFRICGAPPYQSQK